MAKKKKSKKQAERVVSRVLKQAQEDILKNLPQDIIQSADPKKVLQEMKKTVGDLQGTVKTDFNYAVNTAKGSVKLAKNCMAEIQRLDNIRKSKNKTLKKKKEKIKALETDLTKEKREHRKAQKSLKGIDEAVPQMADVFDLYKSFLNAKFDFGITVEKENPRARKSLCDSLRDAQTGEISHKLFYKTVKTKVPNAFDKSVATLEAAEKTIEKKNKIFKALKTNKEDFESVFLSAFKEIDEQFSLKYQAWQRSHAEELFKGAIVEYHQCINFTDILNNQRKVLNRVFTDQTLKNLETLTEKYVNLDNKVDKEMESIKKAKKRDFDSILETLTADKIELNQLSDSITRYQMRMVRTQIPKYIQEYVKLSKNKNGSQTVEEKEALAITRSTLAQYLKDVEVTLLDELDQNILGFDKKKEEYIAEDKRKTWHIFKKAKNLEKLEKEVKNTQEKIDESKEKLEKAVKTNAQDTLEQYEKKTKAYVNEKNKHGFEKNYKKFKNYCNFIREADLQDKVNVQILETAYDEAKKKLDDPFERQKVIEDLEYINLGLKRELHNKRAVEKTELQRLEAKYQEARATAKKYDNLQEQFKEVCKDKDKLRQEKAQLSEKAKALEDHLNSVDNLANQEGEQPEPVQSESIQPEPVQESLVDIYLDAGKSKIRKALKGGLIFGRNANKTGTEAHIHEYARKIIGSNMYSVNESGNEAYKLHPNQVCALIKLVRKRFDETSAGCVGEHVIKILDSFDPKTGWENLKQYVNEVDVRKNTDEFHKNIACDNIVEKLTI